MGPARWPVHRGRLERLLRATLSQVINSLTTSGSEKRQGRAVTHSLELTLRMVGAEESRTLNRQFRGKDSPTNVLTFGYEPLPTASADL
ncbi:MAG: rRNA maturation RNAse YbeY, partial [Burkholderiaceae bacterium]